MDNAISSIVAKQVTRSPLRRLFRLINAERRDILLLYLYAIVGGLISLALPLGIQAIFNVVSFQQLLTSWVVLIAVVLIAVTLSGVLQVFQLTAVEYIQRRVFVHSAFDFAYRIPRLDICQLRGRYVPELVNRFFDTVNVQKSLSKLLMDLPQSSLQIIFGLGLLALYHPLFLLFGVLLVSLLVLLFRLTGPIGLKASLEESKYKYQTVHWLEDLGRSLELFKVYNHTDLPMERTDELVKKYVKARKRHFFILLTNYWVMIGFKILIIGALLILGSVLVRSNEINIGQLVASEIIIILLINSVEKLILSLETVYDMLTALEKIGYVADMPLDKEDGHEIPDNKIGPGLDIRFENLTIELSDAQSYFRDFNARIHSGETIRLSGCGSRPTHALLQALIGFRNDYHGNILINGVSLQSLNRDAYNRKIAPVFSDRLIFDGTLIENIVMDDRSLTPEEMGRLMAAAEATGLIHFIETQPKGLETRLLPQGEKLAANIRGKIVLTRALLTDADLLVFDSPFLALTHKESLSFLGYLRTQKKDVTVLISSNNKDYEEHMDKVLHLPSALNSPTPPAV